MNTIVITSATSGIGLEAVRLLSKEGYQILGIGNSQAICEKADEEIKSDIANASIKWYYGDLKQQREVLRIANEIKGFLDTNGDGRLYALINNAGCARNWFMTTEDGYEHQFAHNYLAGFLMTHELMPYILKAEGRVIMTSSHSYKGIKVHWDDIMLSKKYRPIFAYKQSNLCNILFARGLNDLYSSRGVRAYAVDADIIDDDSSSISSGFMNYLWNNIKHHDISPAILAKTYHFLCNPKEVHEDLYYYLCKVKNISNQVTSESARRLFDLSEQLCGAHFETEA